MTHHTTNDPATLKTGNARCLFWQRPGQALIACCLLLLANASITLDAAQAAPSGRAAQGDILGLVIDLDGRPIANARVSLNGQRTQSNRRGIFRLNSAYPGWLRVDHGAYIARTRAAAPGRPLLVRLTPDDGETLVLNFAGDTMFGRRFFDPNSDGNTSDGLIRLGDEYNSSKKLLAHIKPLLADADMTVVNLESPLALSDPWFNPNGPRPAKFHPDKDFVFASHASAARVLREAGVDVIDLGNNHIYDTLQAGIGETLGALENAGYRRGKGYFGGGSNETDAWQPAFYTVGGQTIALLGCTTITGDVYADSYVAEGSKGGAARCQDALIGPAVTDALASADLVIFMIHGGFEYGRDPSPQVRRLSELARDAGARLVINHHPHVVGGFDWHDASGSLTAWTLGNFLFDQTIWSTYESYLVSVHVRRGEVIRAFAEPLMIEDYVPKGLVGDLAQYVARGAAGRESGPFVVDDGAMEIDLAGRATTTVLAPIVLDGPADTIVRPEQGYISAYTGSGTAQPGRDMLWVGSFEDDDVDSDALEGALWDLGGQDKVIGAGYAYEGEAGVRLRRYFSDASDIVLSHQNRMLLDLADIAPGSKQISITGMARSNGRLALQLSWYADTKGASTLQTVFPDIVSSNNQWQAFRFDVTVPAELVEILEQDSEDVLKPALSIYLRLAPPPRDIATADIDMLRVIDWQPTGSAFGPQYGHARVSGGGQLELQDVRLPTPGIWRLLQLINQRKLGARNIGAAKGR